jgi:hypothetical protein
VALFKTGSWLERCIGRWKRRGDGYGDLSIGGRELDSLLRARKEKGGKTKGRKEVVRDKLFLPPFRRSLPKKRLGQKKGGKEKEPIAAALGGTKGVKGGRERPSKCAIPAPWILWGKPLFNLVGA